MRPIVELREVPCPDCGHAEDRPVAHALQGRAAEVARVDILKGRFQRFRCASCGFHHQVLHPFSLLDAEGRTFLLVRGEDEVHAWPQWEEEAGRELQRMVGAPSRPPTRGPRVRVVFGLDALREKMLCFSAGLDDCLLEALKVNLLASVPGLSVHPHPPRLTSVTEDALRFLVCTEGGGQTSFDVDRELLEHVSSDPRWTEVADQFRTASWVDVLRNPAPPSLMATFNP